MGYPYKMHLKLISLEVSFAQSSFRSCPIVLNFCTELGSDTAVLCANFLKERSTETDAIGKQISQDMN